MRNWFLSLALLGLLGSCSNEFESPQKSFAGEGNNSNPAPETFSPNTSDQVGTPESEQGSTQQPYSGDFKFGDGSAVQQPLLDDEGFDSSEFPGVETSLVNISFEDGGDGDFNDVSFCFNGSFKADGKSVVYIGEKAEKIQVDVKRLTGASGVFYSFQTKDDKGTVGNQRSGSLSHIGHQISFELELEPGSTVQAKYNHAGNAFHDQSGSRSKVVIDRCFNTGG